MYINFLVLTKDFFHRKNEKKRYRKPAMTDSFVFLDILLYIYISKCLLQQTPK